MQVLKPALNLSQFNVMMRRFPHSPYEMIEDVFGLTTDSSVIMAVAFTFFVVSLVHDVTYDKECKMKVRVASLPSILTTRQRCNYE